MTVFLRRLEIGVAVSLFLLGAFAAWEAARMPFGTASMPGPGMMPMALGVLLMVCAAVLVLIELRAPSAGIGVSLGSGHVALAIAAIIVAGLVFEQAGFLITSALFLFVMLVAVSTLGWWRSALAAIAAAIAAGFLFQSLLGVNLPPLPFG